MKTVRVENRTRDSVVGHRVRLADRFWTRMRGFLGRSAPGPGEGLLLVPCYGVHMYGMRFPLDLAFLDSDGVVLRVLEDVKPWTGPARVPGAEAVLEIPVGTLLRTGTTEGDQLIWSSPQGREDDSGEARPGAPQLDSDPHYDGSIP